jgi:DNA recombination-dependent growth factor C
MLQHVGSEHEIVAAVRERKILKVNVVVDVLPAKVGSLVVTKPVREE